MDRMETAVQSLAGNDSEQAARYMSAACNTFGLDTAAFTELMAAQKPKVRKIWTDICWYWVKKLSGNQSESRYDDRNKNSCYVGSYLYSNSKFAFEPLPGLPRDSFISIYIANMNYDHKTIQQSYSSLVFAWLNHLALNEGNKTAKTPVNVLTKMYGDRWYRMPMV